MAELYGDFRAVLSKLPYGAGVDLDVMDRIVNDRIQQIVRHHPWTHLKAKSILQTVVVYETGTVAVTLGSNAITGTGTTWTAPMTGTEFRVSADEAYYTFTRTGAATGTLDRVYEGATDLLAGYKIFKRIYALPSDFGVLKSIEIPQVGGDLDQLELEELNRIDPSRSSYGRPRTYTPIEDDASDPPLAQVELWPIPEVAEGYPLHYTKSVPRLTDTASNILPWISTECLFAGCESDLLKLAKDYQGAVDKEQMFLARLRDMVKEDNRRLVGRILRKGDRWTNHRVARALGTSLSIESKRRRMP